MGTRGGRPEPQPVPAQPGSRNEQRARTGNGRANTGRPRPAAAPPAPPPRRPAEPEGPPRWFQLTTLGLSLAGLAVSVYLTVAHYTESPLAACPENSAINCTKVTTSPEATVLGVFPVAVLGLAFYAAMVALNTPWAWRAIAALAWARLIGAIAGIGFVLYLIYVELFMVNAVCLWCTGVHAVTFALFGFIVFGAASWGLRQRAGTAE